MVHNAFSVVQLVTDVPVRIESVGIWDDCLLVGCYDGSLRVYTQELRQGASPPIEKDTKWASASLQPLSYKLKESKIGFAKKAILGLEIHQTANLMITLSDGINIHTLPDLDMVISWRKTRGASSFAWNKENGMLCAVVSKRIFTFRFDGLHTFSELREVIAPDVVRSMAWCGDVLCVGLQSKKEYWIIKPSTGAMAEVFACGRTAPPMVVPVADGEVLLGKDNIGVFVDAHGKSTRPGGLSWSEAPAQVVLAHPYILGRLSRFLEVRSLRPGHSLVQTLPLRDVNSLSASPAGILARCNHAVFCASPVPLAKQVAQLTASFKYDDALALCELVPHSDGDQRKDMENSVRVRYGYYMFDEGDFEGAMHHFGSSALPLATLLALYPFLELPSGAASLIAPPFSDVHGGGSPVRSDAEEEHSLLPLGDLVTHNTWGEEREPLGPEDLTAALVALVGYLIGKRPAALAEAQAEEALKAPRNPGRSQIKGVEGPSGGDSDVDTEPLQPSEPLQPVSQNGPAVIYATVLDTALLQALLAIDQAMAAPDELAEAGTPTEGNKAGAKAVGIVSASSRKQAAITAASAAQAASFRLVAESMPAWPSSLALGSHTSPLLQLLNGPNFCDTGVCERTLLAAQRSAEVVALLRSRGLHCRALELLRQLAVPPDPDFWPEDSLQYLKALGPENLPLVLEFSVWLLHEHPRLGLELFTTGSPPLPTGTVLAHLKEHAPALQTAYIEHMLRSGGNTPPSGLHDELVLLYLGQVLGELAAVQAGRGVWDEAKHSEARLKLQAVLEKSHTYSPEALLPRLPPGYLAEERVLLLARLRQHLLVLALQARKLKAPGRCLEYCDSVYRSALPEPSKPPVVPRTAPPRDAKDPEAAAIYLTLLRVYLDPTATLREFQRAMAALSTPGSPDPQAPASVVTSATIPTSSAAGPAALSDEGSVRNAKAGQSGRIRRGAYIKKIVEIQQPLVETPEVAEASLALKKGAEKGPEEKDLWGLDAEVMLPEALDMLAKSWDRVDCGEAFQMLPPDIDLQSILGFLEPVLRRASEARRNAAVIKSLRRSESLQIREELVRCRSRMVKVTAERACAICRKRIGSSVFAAYPNGILVHFVCYQDTRSRSSGAQPAASQP